MASVYAMRVNLSIAIVAMVKSNSENNFNTSSTVNISEVCKREDSDSGSSNSVSFYNTHFITKSSLTC